MGYIPEDTQWFVAELVMEITVEGDPRNVVHRNLILVSASEPTGAYQKAQDWGLKGETSYENCQNRMVDIRFRGISKLDVVIEPLMDGAELMCEEHIAIPADEIRRWIPTQTALEAFREPAIRRGMDPDRPDYASRDVLAEVIQRLAKASVSEAQEGKPVRGRDDHR